MDQNLNASTHKRFNILTGEWVLVSPHRAKRPWQGKHETTSKKEGVKHDPTCYLCAGNKRINGETNPDYISTYVFKNDFGALLESGLEFEYNKGLLKAEGETGICKVICFSPNHSETLADMKISDIVNVISIWQKEYHTLSKLSTINHVQIFENKGATMGCSNPHPHGQIWAQRSIPNEVVKKTISQKEYFNSHNKSLLSSYVQQELGLDERIIFENDTFVSLVPFWAVWPYEVMILPKNQKQHIAQLSDQEKTDFAEQIKIVTQKYDLLFDTSFPYSSGIHQAPTDKDYPEWHMHMSFFPPLLRSATVKKFMVGYEMFGMPQRDISAETAAAQLKAL
jgi:UDPglucose--hexose-1-phosphate uridylyltransferase